MARYKGPKDGKVVSFTTTVDRPEAWEDGPTEIRAEGTARYSEGEGWEVQDAEVVNVWPDGTETACLWDALVTASKDSDSCPHGAAICEAITEAIQDACTEVDEDMWAESVRDAYDGQEWDDPFRGGYDTFAVEDDTDGPYDADGRL